MRNVVHVVLASSDILRIIVCYMITYAISTIYCSIHRLQLTQLVRFFVFIYTEEKKKKQYLLLAE